MEDEQEDEPAYDDPGQQAEMCQFRLRNLVYVDSATQEALYRDTEDILWFMIYNLYGFNSPRIRIEWWWTVYYV